MEDDFDLIDDPFRYCDICDITYYDDYGHSCEECDIWICNNCWPEHQQLGENHK